MVDKQAKSSSEPCGLRPQGQLVKGLPLNPKAGALHPTFTHWWASQGHILTSEGHMEDKTQSLSQHKHGQFKRRGTTVTERNIEQHTSEARDKQQRKSGTVVTSPETQAGGLQNGLQKQLGTHWRGDQPKCLWFLHGRQLRVEKSNHSS